MEYVLAFIAFIIGLGYGFALGQLKKQETKNEGSLFDYWKFLTSQVVDRCRPGQSIRIAILASKDEDDDDDDDYMPTEPDLRNKWENN